MMQILLAACAASVGDPSIVLPGDFTVSGPLTLDPDDAYSDVFFETNGDITKSTDNDATRVVVGTWISRKDGLDPSLYEVRATLISGTFTRGTAGSYLSSDTERNFGITQSTIGNKNTVFDAQVREKTNHSNTDTARITLNATVST